ncbi:hypothetical protein QOZ80_2BG0172990 [Eleusine coracana subsp. coracana]|nr:hypothetical protein QOZ80_2BG0172990 [Eleusine coracana subsp. coracana]
MHLLRSCQSRTPCCRSVHGPSFPGARTRVTAAPTAPGLAAAHSRAAGKLLPRTPRLAQDAGGKPRRWLPIRAVAGSTDYSSSTGNSIQVEGKLLVLCKVESPNSNLRLSLQLVSATIAGDDGRGVIGEETVLNTVIGGGEIDLEATLSWDETMLGMPGAVVVKNNSDFPVYLKLLTCSWRSAGDVHFPCNGWVYPVGKHPYRLFFTNHACVKETTPSPLLKYREDELRQLRGDDRPASDEQPLQEWDRVYDYALYNDLGNPDLRKDLARPVLGGSQQYPYPRRIKTGRPPSQTDPRTESRAPLDHQIYLPCDERVGDPVERAPYFPNIGGHFKSFAEIYSLFGLNNLGEQTSQREKFPVPQVISVNPINWRTDKEFGRQMLAGPNPVCIKRVLEFPITSELDRRVYGDQDSKITRDHIEKNMGAMTVDQAVKEGRPYVVDHHDFMMPYLKRINELPGDDERGEISPRKAYAARTLLFLNDDSTLKPLAIELSSPNPEDERLGAVSTVYTPPDTGDDDVLAGRFTIWDLAKAHATVNDASNNNFVYHWLNIHVTLEPVIIATNRQLSVLHPIHKLLKPHFRKTLHINTTTRQIIISSGDPRNLIKRGMAKGDPRNPENLELFIKDYPFAVDGLGLWIAIKNWVKDYCAIYYPDDSAVTSDSELQDWWREVRQVGHADLSEASWWPALDCLADLEEICTTIIWLGSGFHSAIGLWQFTYQGFVPCRPTITSRSMPEAGEEVTESDFLESITPRKEALSGMAMAARSMMLEREVYLGQRPDTEKWTSDERAAMALARFRWRLEGVADDIERRNGDPALRNRSGPVELPYTRLTPTMVPGPIVGGIPNGATN